MALTPRSSKYGKVKWRPGRTGQGRGLRQLLLSPEAPAFTKGEPLKMPCLQPTPLPPKRGMEALPADLKGLQGSGKEKTGFVYLETRGGKACRCFNS